jgi:hypothetical protein
MNAVGTSPPVEDAHPESPSPTSPAGGHRRLVMALVLVIAVLVGLVIGLLVAQAMGGSPTGTDAGEESASRSAWYAGADEPAGGVGGGSTADLGRREVATARPAGEADDAEESGDGTVDRYSSDLELVSDGSADQTVGIRFPALDVPAGATIISAHLELVADETGSEPTSLQVAAHAVGDAPSFSSSRFDVSARPLTSASVAWSDLAPWTEVGEVHTSPDLTPVVQEIVDAPDWVSGSALALIITGSGRRTTVAHDDDPSDAPTLVVTYTSSRPEVQNPGSQLNNDGDAVALQIVASDPNGDRLTYGATGLPPGLVIDPATGVISGTIGAGGAAGHTVTVTVSDGTETASTSLNWVVLGNDGHDVTFAVIGDYGIQTTDEGDVAALVDSWNVDFVATVGDNTYSSNLDANIGQFYHQYIKPYTGSYGPGSPDVNRFFPALGNHDFEHPEHLSCDASGACTGEYLDYFELPGNERYYDVEWGPVHLFIVNSIELEPDGISADSTQAQWLQSALASSTAPWKLVLLHYPPYSSGGINGDREELRWPFEEWGATAVLAGHEHVYERLMVGGIPHFVNGLGGAAIYTFGSPRPESEARYNGDFGAMRIRASSSDIVFEFINRSGDLVDVFSMVPADAADPSSAPPTGRVVVSQPAGVADTAEEFGDGTMYRHSSDLELVNDGTGDQTVGIRFPALDVPAGATITSAYLELVTDETGWEPTSLVLSAHAVADASPFSSSSFDISSRPTTSASVAWSDLPPWTTVGEVHTSPDLAPVVQEIVDTAGWVSGNALGVIISGSGRRTAVGHDGNPTDTPTLIVTYTMD